MNGDEFVLNDLEAVSPNPISPRICKCGCSNVFQPKRQDQVFINKKHADFFNYHHVKKPRKEALKKINGFHEINDQLCHELFALDENNVTTCSLSKIRKAGFKDDYYHGEITINGEKFRLTYNYYFRCFWMRNTSMVEIRKR